MRYHSNRGLDFIKDTKKSYVYVIDGNRDIGIFAWDYRKKCWRYEPTKRIKGKRGN